MPLSSGLTVDTVNSGRGRLVLTGMP
jgi:hypothetical protein